MNDERLGALYHELANLVIDSIPERWSKVYLYGEVAENSQTAYFYYYSENQTEAVYSHDIPDLFQVNQESHDQLWHQLIECLIKLREVFKDNEQEPWTNLTMYFNSAGKFNIDYRYDDLTQADPHERKTIWKYIHLGVVPKSSSGKKHLEKYLESIEGKTIE